MVSDAKGNKPEVSTNDIYNIALGAIEVLVKEHSKAVVEHLRIGPISIIPHLKFDTKFSP